MMETMILLTAPRREILMKTKYFILLSLIILCVVSFAASDDLSIKLTSNDGSNGVWIQNSNDVVLSTFSSNGNAYFKGNVGIGTQAASGNALTVNGIVNVGAEGLSFSDSTVMTSTTPFTKSYGLNSADGGLLNVVYVDNDGNVGIGTQSSLQAKLHVNGNSYFDENVTLNSGINIKTDEVRCGASNGLTLSNSSGQKGLHINTAGYIGIGTDSPSALVHVSSAGVSSGQYLLKISSGSANDEQLFIVGENVGIGTTNPGALFTVKDNVFQVDESGDMIKIKNLSYSWPSSAGSGDRFLTNDNSGNLTWNQIGTSLDGSGSSGYSAYFTDTDYISSSSIYEDADGVGIGTNNPQADYKLHVEGSQYAAQDTKVEEFVKTSTVTAVGTQGLKIVDSSDNYGIVINQDGFVGVGTDVAVSTLTVNGTCKIADAQSFWAGTNEGETKTAAFPHSYGDPWTEYTNTITVKGGIITSWTQE